MVANRKEEPFVSRATFRIPWILFVLCTVVNVAGYLMMIFGPDLTTCFWMPRFAIAAALFGIALIQAVWVGWHLYVRRWTKHPDAFNVSDIPIYIESEAPKAK